MFYLIEYIIFKTTYYFNGGVVGIMFIDVESSSSHPFFPFALMPLRKA